MTDDRSGSSFSDDRNRSPLSAKPSSTLVSNNGRVSGLVEVSRPTTCTIWMEETREETFSTRLHRTLNSWWSSQKWHSLWSLVLDRMICREMVRNSTTYRLFGRHQIMVLRRNCGYCGVRKLGLELTSLMISWFLCDVRSAYTSF